MASVLLYSGMEFASAFAPSLRAFLILRAFYGIAMGGEWGVGASLAFESIPVRSRGLVSGLLQAGYPSGYLLASIVFGLAFEHIGCAACSSSGGAGAAGAVHPQQGAESATWEASRTLPAARGLWSGLSGHWLLALYAIALMTCFNFFSHGTQDLYPHFLEAQRGFSTGTRSIIAIVYNIGAICGGIAFGTLSSRIGRRRAIAIAAGLSLLVLPFWAYSLTPLALAAAAFCDAVHGAGRLGCGAGAPERALARRVARDFSWLRLPAGNLLASYNATLQTTIAENHTSAGHPDFSFAFVVVVGTVAALLVVLSLLGPERRDVRFGLQ